MRKFIYKAFPWVMILGVVVSYFKDNAVMAFLLSICFALWVLFDLIEFIHKNR